MRGQRAWVTAIALLSCFCFSLLLVGCENEDIQSWRNETKRLRERAEHQIFSEPYRRGQHMAFKSYFTSLGAMALSLRQDSGKRQRFNEAASRSGFTSLCQDLFMSEALWQRLMVSCTKNRFFLCAEEVRAYPSFVRALRDGLRPDLQRRFDHASQCVTPRNRRTSL